MLSSVVAIESSVLAVVSQCGNKDHTKLIHSTFMVIDVI